MTRKHYKRVAAALLEARPSLQNENAEELGRWLQLVRDIAGAFAAENPKFSITEFKAAAGV